VSDLFHRPRGRAPSVFLTLALEHRCRSRPCRCPSGFFFLPDLGVDPPAFLLPICSFLKIFAPCLAFCIDISPQFSTLAFSSALTSHSRFLPVLKPCVAFHPLVSSCLSSEGVQPLSSRPPADGVHLISLTVLSDGPSVHLLSTNVCKSLDELEDVVLFFQRLGGFASCLSP